MFSGIIQVKSKAIKIEKNKSSMRLTFSIPKEWIIELGESINIDGVCSTVEKLTNNSFSVYYMPETIDKTTLNSLENSHHFNLERCLTLNSLIGGHLVNGHVDTTAQIIRIEKSEESKVIHFKIPTKFTKYIIYKGSITVNGVSLTVVHVDTSTFSVSLIPYTLINTNLGELKVENRVNIEVDMIGKYLEKLHKKS